MKGNDKIAEISLIGHVKVPVIKKLHRKTFQFPSCEAQNERIQMVGTSSTHRAEENWIKKKKVRCEKLDQECTIPREQVVRGTKFSTVSGKVLDSSVYNLLHATLLAPR
jgi:hypothetical protein